MGGRLQHFVSDWEKITQNDFILRIVSQGYRLELENEPPLTTEIFWTPLPSDPIRSNLLIQEVNDLLEKNAIEEVTGQDLESPAFYTKMFLVKKSSGGYRPIQNLRPLNKYVKKAKFKMETLRSILSQLETGDWAVKVDLKDAYLHVLVHESSRKYLRFAIKGRVYQWRTLPFGLSSSPRIFTKLVSAVVAFLRQQTIHLHAYLDDCLSNTKSYSATVVARDRLLEVFSMVGFLINYKKSHLIPTQILQFLGAILDLKQGLIFPTPARVDSLIELISALQKKKMASARHFLVVLGHMAALIDLVPWAQLQMRPIQFHLIHHWNQSSLDLGALVPVDQELIEHLNWWTNRENLEKGVRFRPESQSLTLTSDSSKEGWGAHILDQEVSGKWTMSEALKHINFLELKAVYLALQALKDLVSGQAVRARVDNTTAMFYINKMGGTHSQSLCSLTWDLMHWCKENCVRLKATYLAGVYNLIADMLSRKSKVFPNEWTLCRNVVARIFKDLGRPHIDLFASSINNRLPTFVSMVEEENSFAVDALALSWEGMFAYAFPPISLIPRVLQKIKCHNCTVILVVPKWPGRPWYSELLDLLIDYPVRIPVKQGVLFQPHNRKLVHQDLDYLNLTAFKLSRSDSLQKVFLQRLQKESHSQEDPVLWRHITPELQATSVGVKNGLLIPLIQL